MYIEHMKYKISDTMLQFSEACIDETSVCEMNYINLYINIDHPAAVTFMLLIVKADMENYEKRNWNQQGAKALYCVIAVTSHIIDFID